MEEQDSAASRGQDRAPESPAQTSFDARESSAPPPAAPEHGYSESQPGEGAAPSSSPAPGGKDRPRTEGGYARYRDRGGRSRGGRGRRPTRPERVERLVEEVTVTTALHAKVIVRWNPFNVTSPGLAKKMIIANAKMVRVTKTKTFPPVWTNLPKAKELRKRSGEPHEADEFHEERTEADRERPNRNARVTIAVNQFAIAAVIVDTSVARPPRWRPRSRSGARGYERERSTFRVLRGQVDRIRHNLESVLRDLERVVTALQEAERERQLTEQELESLQEQIDNSSADAAPALNAAATAATTKNVAINRTARGALKEPWSASVWNAACSA